MTEKAIPPHYSFIDFFCVKGLTFKAALAVNWTFVFIRR